MSLLHPLCVLALFASPLLSAYEQPANTDRARRPSSLGQAEGITLVSDGFTGSGPLLQGVPEEDLDGGGWKTTDAAIQPRRDGGRLVSGGADGVAAIMLPPLSPHGEVTITVTLSLRGDHGMMLGFTDAVHHPKEGGSGPLVRVAGDGRLAIYQDAATRLKEVIVPRPAKPDGTVALVILYRLWQKTVSMSVNGKELVSAPLPVVPATPHRCFTVAFEDADAKGSPALDALCIDYVPLARPVPMVPHRTIAVTDTSLTGITKAIRDANAKSGPDNIITVSIPKANYRFQVPDGSKDAQLFLVLGLKHLIIDWNDSTITIGNPDRGLFSLSHGNHVTVRNIASIDYPTDNLPFTQGTVRAFDKAARSFELEIDEGFPLPNHDLFTRTKENWGQLIDPARPGRRQQGAALEYWVKEIQPIQGRIFRYVLDTQLHAFRVGSRFAHCPRAGNEIFRIFEAKNIRLENITGHACANFWSMIYFTTISYHNVKVLLKPGRLMSVNGDMATGVKNKLWMEDCVFEGNADDICHQFQGEATFITRTTFRNNRRFGVWFNTGEFGVVKDCRFDGVGSYAIVGMKEPGMEEGIRFASRNVLCVGNTIQNMWGDGIFLNSTHTRQDPSPHWNTYWRLVGNDSTTPIRIQNATNVRCVGNSGGQPGVAAKIDIDARTCKDVTSVAAAFAPPKR